MTKSARKGFVGSLCFFILTSLSAKIIGAIYRIPLTNVLGIQGIAQYQLVFPFFALVLALIGGGVPTAVSRLIAFQNCGDNSNKKNANLLSAAVFFIFMISVVGFILIAAMSKVMSKVQSQPQLYLCYLAIAPSILFVGVSNVFKGYFLGMGNMTPSSLSNLLEQITKLTLGLTLAKIFSRYGNIYSVAGALLAITIAEVVEMIALLILYLSKKHTPSDKLIVCLKTNSRLFFSNLTPITLSGLIFPVVAFVDSLIIIKLLAFSNADTAYNASQYGLLTGPVNSLINMPVILSLSLAMAIIPAVSSALAAYDVESIKEKTSMSIKFCFFVGVPCFFGFFALATPILAILYPTMSEQELLLASKLLQVQSVNVLLLSILEILTAMLQGLDRSKRVLLNVAIGGGIKISLQSILVPYIQIMGVCIANIVFFGCGMLLNLFLYKKLVGSNAILFKNVSKLLSSGAIMFALVLLSTYFLKSNIAKLALGIVVGIASYFAMVFSIRAMHAKDFKMLCFFKKSETPKKE